MIITLKLHNPFFIYTLTKQRGFGVTTNMQSFPCFIPQKREAQDGAEAVRLGCEGEKTAPSGNRQREAACDER